MQIHVSPHDGSPIYLQIVQQVTYLAASGRLEPGEQLPPVRRLAEQLVVNPNTVARAYRELERSGVVESRQGAGVFLAKAASSPLNRRERLKILRERIDMLLAEAQHMSIDVETVIGLVRQRDLRIQRDAGRTDNG